MKTLNLKKQSNYNPFFISENNVLYNEIENIIIYNNEGILAQTNRGWFSSSNNYFEELNFTFELKNKRKEDFTKKQCYIVKNKLYIHIDLLKNISIQKHVKNYTTNTENVFRDIMSFETNGKKYVFNKDTKKYILQEGIQTITIEYNFKFEKTEFGEKMQMLAEKAKEHGLKFSSYDFERLSEIFDINVK